MSAPFEPSFRVPPGETVQEFMDENHLDVHATAHLLIMSETKLERLLNGNEKIDARMAQRLHSTFGPTPEYWMALEHNYRKARECDDEID